MAQPLISQCIPHGQRFAAPSPKAIFRLSTRRTTKAQSCPLRRPLAIGTFPGTTKSFGPLHPNKWQRPKRESRHSYTVPAAHKPQRYGESSIGLDDSTLATQSMARSASSAAFYRAFGREGTRSSACDAHLSKFMTEGQVSGRSNTESRRTSATISKWMEASDVQPQRWADTPITVQFHSIASGGVLLRPRILATHSLRFFCLIRRRRGVSWTIQGTA